MIPNFVDPAYSADLTDMPAKDRVRTALYIGRLSVAVKGLDLLLEGYAQFLKSSMRYETRLVVAGPDDRGGLLELTRLAHRLGIEDKVSFVGPVFGDEKTNLLKGSTVFVHTSRSEGMPLSILEAMALRRPVLITPETNLGQHISQSDAGLVVPGTIEDIARGLHEVLCEDSTILEQMGIRARQLVLNHFTRGARGGGHG